VIWKTFHFCVNLQNLLQIHQNEWPEL
jgi:hypothetical protein